MILDIARKALPLMTPAQRAEAEQILNSLEPGAIKVSFRELMDGPSPVTVAEMARRANDAFQRDMQPVCAAVAEALHSGDVAALKGLRALLPGLLAEVNRAPGLADLLAHQLGQAFLEGLGFPGEGTR